MAMEGNRDEAERCARLAEEAAAAGSLARAERLLAKALRLFPSAAAAQQLRALQDRRPAPAPAPATAPAPASPRRPSAAAAPTADSAATEVSAESVELVKRINRCTDYYEILEVSKSSSEEEIKKAYRKLSLKVHPDKNKAPGAEESFKAVARAFQCLSDSSARAHYDRCGQEGGHAAQPQWAPRAARYRGASPFFDDDAFDPNEVFNAFFGMHNVRHANGRVYRAHFGQRRGGADRSHGGGASVGPSVLGLLQLLPLLFIFLYAMLPPSEPPYKLHQVEPYTLERRTSGFGVPFYVRSDFDVQHPERSRQRRGVDQMVDREYRDGVETRCYYERVQQQHQQQLQRWRQGPKARDMAMPNCMELRRLQQTAY